MKRLLVCAALVLLLAGCGASHPASSVHHDRSTLQWGLVGVSDVPTLDPALASDPVSISVASLVYGGLVRLDAALRVQPDGARSWHVSRDGTIYTFHLRPNLRFADGRLVTAAHFAAAIQRSLSGPGASGAGPYYLGLIAHGGVTVLDSRTIRIALVRPAAHFLAELAFPTSFVPDPAVMTRYGDTWTDHAAGFGPYRVEAWEHSRSLTLVPNPYYYRGKPSFRSIVVHFYGEHGALAAYDRGALDVVSGFPPGGTVPGHHAGTNRIPALAMDYLAFNTHRLPFFRLRARYAFAAAVTPRTVMSATGQGAALAHGFLPSAFGIQTGRWRPSASPRAYLTAARYPRAGNLPPLLLVLPRDPAVHALAQALAAVWEKDLGARITIQQLDTSLYDRVLADHAFDLALVRWGGDYPDPQDFLGTQLGDSSDNVTGWTRTAMNDDITLADSYNPRDPRRTALFRDASSLAAVKVPILPLDEPLITALISPELHGVAQTALGTITGDWTHARLSG